MADPLAPWTPLMDRIKAQVPNLAGVYSAWELASVVERSQLSPSVAVLFNGETPVDTTATGDRSMMAVSYLVVLSIRNAQDTLGGIGIITQAGALLDALATAIAGWAPAPEFRPFKRAKAPKPYYTPGFAYIPLAFETRSVRP